MTTRLFFAICLVFLACGESGDQTESNQPGMDGFFTLLTMDGREISFQDWQGKVTVVDFWATWCKPCIKEIPKYNRLNDKYASQPFRMIGITVDSGKLEDIKPFVTAHNIRYPVFLGNEAAKAHFGGIAVYPTTFVLDKNGKIRKQYYGSPPGKIEEIDALVQELLSEN